MITQAGLGTTAVSSLPYVLSQFTRLTFGSLTVLFNIIWVLLQIILLRKEFEKRQFLQLVIGPILGFAIDGSAVIVAPFYTTQYIGQLVNVIIGCVILSLGVFLQIKAAVIYNPAEGLVYAISKLLEKKFGFIKISFDVSLVMLAALVSVLVLGRLVGVREGTLITAVLIGPLVNLFQHLWPIRLVAEAPKGVKQTQSC